MTNQPSDLLSFHSQRYLQTDRHSVLENCASTSLYIHVFSFRQRRALAPNTPANFSPFSPFSGSSLGSCHAARSGQTHRTGASHRSPGSGSAPAQQSPRHTQHRKAGRKRAVGKKKKKNGGRKTKIKPPTAPSGPCSKQESALSTTSAKVRKEQNPRPPPCRQQALLAYHSAPATPCTPSAPTQGQGDKSNGILELLMCWHRWGKCTHWQPQSHSQSVTSLRLFLLVSLPFMSLLACSSGFLPSL